MASASLSAILYSSATALLWRFSGERKPGKPPSSGAVSPKTSLPQASGPAPPAKGVQGLAAVSEAARGLSRKASGGSCASLVFPVANSANLSHGVLRPSFFIYFLENFLEVFCDIEPGHGVPSRLRLAGRGKIHVSISFGVNAAMGPPCPEGPAMRNRAPMKGLSFRRVDGRRRRARFSIRRRKALRPVPPGWRTV